ncbi:MAG: type II toxin-antitoxin system VapC family toxin [Myxococcales bacterium]|nr:type II toxin-antitoxin system VapC family toxin [Myxococcales bacterium]
MDTNILLDILRPNPQFVDASLALLERLAITAQLTICEIVYAELSANFETQESLDAFLDDVSIRVDTMQPQVRFQAGQAWKRYRQAGGQRERILPDFLIGAHARYQTSSLLSRDRGFYQSYFPELRVLDH